AYNVKEPNGKAAESAANRLLRHPEIKEAIYQAEGRIRDAVEREVAARRVEEVFSIEEKRALLKKIATGQIMVEQYYKGKDCHMCTQYARPNFWHMLSAIKEDSRIAGHYPAQQKTTKIKSSFPVLRDGGFQRQEEYGRVDNDDTQGQIEESSQQQCEPPLQQTETQQPSEAASLSPLKETLTRQQNTTTDEQKAKDTNPHPGVPISIGTELPTITHDELMQLLYPNKYKMKQPD
ncbi:MAG: terminase small subunit, partial [Taibaiella sp.]|nr:terminase small subunit [Taibaiella sp.]